MGMLDSNKLIGTLHGTVGDLVFVRMPDGRIIVRHRPKREAEFRVGELANQARFRLASAYMKGISKQPALYAPYQWAALKRQKRACDLAVADYSYPPII